ncbi:MAG TPA: hypothetical protein EYP25_07965, partial [Anaerolineae bacterium]|nr:hypothetical protein [Anaerolineae bacterium]
KRAVREAAAVYLATDPDREGEAIAFDLLELLGDEGPEGSYLFRSDAIGTEKELGEPQRAQGQADAAIRKAALHFGDLDAAATQVDDEPLSQTGGVHRAQRAVIAFFLA